MSDERSATTASRVRGILKQLGVEHAVGLSWNNTGAPIVVVDIPPGVDQSAVRASLTGLDVQIRRVARDIIAH